MFSFIDKEGKRQEVKPTEGEMLSWYKEAAEANMSVPAYLAAKYPADESQGTTFEQFAASRHLFLKADRSHGLRAPSMKEVLNGSAMFAGTVIKEASPASRILFPAVIIEAIENKLKTDYSSDASVFEQMIAVDLSIAGAKFEQPVLNFSRPEAARHQAISQLSLPNSMLSITASDVARKIPTISLGMEISSEAEQITSLDLVALALVRQAEVERAERVTGYIQALVDGDVDLGMAALNSVTSDSLYGATAAAALSHWAWVKFLRRNWKKRRISHAMADLNTLIKIERREEKPVYTNVDANGSQIAPAFDVINPQWNNVKFFLLDDSVIAADKIVGVDSRYGIVRARNIQADYQAVEEFVLRKMKAMRFDFGEMCYRLFDDAWDVMTISA